jgi:3-deoxy-D-manno-octulosonic-acid transferase
MMVFLYALSLRLYGLLLRLAALWNPKARLFVNGRKSIFVQIQEKLAGKSGRRVWFHCASLGEFEQARPVMEGFKKQHPDFILLLTFFSPSGYEVRKKYPGADAVFYLPLDSATHARQLTDLFQPEMVYFVKYEFWYFYLTELRKRQIPVILFSAAFRANQLFFKPYGGFYRKMLHSFTHIFVQNQISLELLKKSGLKNASLAGDTRFDRVMQTALQRQSVPLAEHFKQGQKLLVAGSVWGEDLEVLIPFVNQFPHPIKIILAPHEMDEWYFSKMEAEMKKTVIRFSKATPEAVKEAQVLLIDNVGMLSALYAYAEFAFVGGGYRQGLHNILEAATFGMPVFFGSPHYQNFQEAVDLLTQKAAFAVKNEKELTAIFTELYQNEPHRQRTAETARQYVQRHAGATDLVLAFYEL